MDFDKNIVDGAGSFQFRSFVHNLSPWRQIKVLSKRMRRSPSLGLSKLH
jgi:hypothetical protein